MDWPIFLSGIAIGAIIAALPLVLRLLVSEKKQAAVQATLDNHLQNEAALQDRYRALAQDVLKATQNDFLELAQEKLKQAQSDGAYDLEKRQKAIADLVDPVSKTLKDMEQRIEQLGKAGSGLESQLKLFAEDQKHLKTETQNLVRLLRNPVDRGNWGEMQLQKALEMVGMVEGQHFMTQQNLTHEGKRDRPDFIINLPGALQIVIDVKAPIEPYWDALESADNEQAQLNAQKAFTRKVRDHLKGLSSKEYWKHFGGPEFVVMFLPTEGLYTLAISQDKQLIEDAAKNNVILASPTTLMGLLRLAMHGWAQQNIAEEAKNIADLGTQLYNRLAVFGEHMQKLGRNLGTAVNAYNGAVGSLESNVLPAARKMRDIQLQNTGKEVPELPPIEAATRDIIADELVKKDEERLELHG